MLRVDPHEYVATVRSHPACCLQDGGSVLLREFCGIMEADGRLFGKRETPECVLNDLPVMLGSLFVCKRLRAAGVEFPTAVFVEDIGEAHQPLAPPAAALGIGKPNEEVSVGDRLGQHPRGNAALGDDVQSKI